MNRSGYHTTTLLALATWSSLALTAQGQPSEPPPPCGTGSPTGTEGSVLTPLQITTLARPTAGEDGRADVGGVLLTAFEANVFPRSIKLKRPIHYVGTGPTAGFVVDIDAGELPVEFSNEQAIVYAGQGLVQPSKSEVKKSFTSIGMTRDPAKPPRIVFGWGKYTYGDNVPDAEVETVTCVAAKAGSWRRELVYTGASKGTVNLLYREFSGDLARPAFSQSLTYDLSQGGEIGYRGARLLVISATNTEVRFKVLAPLSGD